MVGILPNLSHFFDPFNIVLPDPLLFVFGAFVVIFFVLGASNSLNLLDGLDGLCGGVTAILLSDAFIAMHLATWENEHRRDQYDHYLLSLSGGYRLFAFNRIPPKFYGHAELCCGYVTRARMICFANKFHGGGRPRFIIGLPILDTATALVRRLSTTPLFVSDGVTFMTSSSTRIPLKNTVATCYAWRGCTHGRLTMSQILPVCPNVYVVVIFASARLSG